MRKIFTLFCALFAMIMVMKAQSINSVALTTAINSVENDFMILSDVDNDNWTIKFFEGETAELDLIIDGEKTHYTFTGDADRTPDTSQQPGALTSLAIDGFMMKMVYNNGVSFSNQSLQYRVYEDGAEDKGTWNRINAGGMSFQTVYNEEEDVYEKVATFSAAGKGINVSDGLSVGKDYVLEIMYQVVANGEYNFLLQNRESGCFRFSIANPDGIYEATVQNASQGTCYTLDGRKVGKQNAHGIYIVGGKKVLK